MNKGLDPKNPAFKNMGEVACRRTVLCIAKDGTLAWVPFECLRQHFKQNCAPHRFEMWLQRLTDKEFYRRNRRKN